MSSSAPRKLVDDDIHAAAEQFCAELTRAMPGDTIMLADTGHAGMWLGGLHDRMSRQQRFLRSAGHLGWPFISRRAPALREEP